MKQKYIKISNNVSYWYAYNAKRCFVVCSCFFVASFAVYMLLTVATISSSIAFESVTREIKNTESKIATLEAERIARMKSIDLTFAKDKGFVEVSPTRYIASNEKVERFTLR